MNFSFVRPREGIEGIPVIIRFKTTALSPILSIEAGIEGIPVIIRFKTLQETLYLYVPLDVLKVFQL